MKKKEIPLQKHAGEQEPQSAATLFLSFLIQTVLSVQESHLLGTCVFADFTAGMELHHSPKIFNCISASILTDTKMQKRRQQAVVFSFLFRFIPKVHNAN